MKKGMIKVIVLYPSGDGKTFDMDYYINKHLPLAKGLLGDVVKGLTVEKGLAGAAPDIPVPFMAVASIYFDSVEAFQTAYGPHMDALGSDLPNYTNTEPITLISEVMI